MIDHEEYRRQVRWTNDLTERLVQTVAEFSRKNEIGVGSILAAAGKFVVRLFKGYALTYDKGTATKMFGDWFAALVKDLQGDLNVAMGQNDMEGPAMTDSKEIMH